MGFTRTWLCQAHSCNFWPAPKRVQAPASMSIKWDNKERASPMSLQEEEEKRSSRADGQTHRQTPVTKLRHSPSGPVGKDCTRACTYTRSPLADAEEGAKAIRTQGADQNRGEGLRPPPHREHKSSELTASAPT